MSSLAVNLAGLALIGLIAWWFWLSQPKAQQVTEDAIDILVDNGTYSPSVIEIRPGRKVRLRFLRKDASPCAEKVIFDSLGISADLLLDEVKELEVEVAEPGEYPFTCQMQMYRGTLIVA